MKEKNMMIRQAKLEDLHAVLALYEAVLAEEAAGGFQYTQWRKGVYPTEETALRGIEAGELYLGEEDGQVWGAVIVNGVQAPEYGCGAWTLPAEDRQVGVIHTLCIHPKSRGQGRAGQLVHYGEELCRAQGKHVMRLDTRVTNLPGLRLYPTLGYQAAGQVELRLAGGVPARMQLYEKAL